MTKILLIQYSEYYYCYYYYYLNQEDYKVDYRVLDRLITRFVKTHEDERMKFKNAMHDMRLSE